MWWISPRPPGTPWLGTTITLETTPVPSPEVGILMLGSNVAWQGAPLPASLATLGMPGCDLLVPLSSISLTANANRQGVATVSVPLPDRPMFRGDLYTQALVHSPGSNALDLELTAGLQVRVR